MKVLLIDVNCKNSSTGKIVYDLYQNINTNGNEAAVCYGRGDKINEKGIFKFGIDMETLAHALMTRITGYTGCYSFFSSIRLKNFIKKFKPDIVHIHEMHAYFLNIKPLLSYLRKKEIKTVFTMHCDFMFTGKCGCAYECEKWKDGCGKCPRIKEYPKSLFFDRTAEMYKAKKKLFIGWKDIEIVFPSKWLLNRAEQSFFKENIFHVIHNGIDENIFYPRESASLRKKLGLTQDEKIVLALAPNLMSENKGGKIVLDLAKTLIGEKIKFILIGVDDGLNVDAPNVIVHGKINDKDLLAQYYSLADVFLICSKQETFPTTCLEAQCCGTRIVGFDVGGTKETAIENMGNMFVPYGDVTQLKQALLSTLSQDAKVYSTLAEKAQNEYCRKNMTKKYGELYKKIMEEKNIENTIYCKFAVSL